MEKEILLTLVHNAALLMLIVYLYDFASTRWRWRRLAHLPVGLALGLVGVVLMMTPLHMTEGVFYDARCVLVAMAGLFFGLVPTLIAALITAAFRFYLGGAGMWTGIAVIVASAGIGLSWRHYRNRLGEQVRVRELFLFGTVVAASMLLLQFTLPDGKALLLLSSIALPVMLIFPPLMVLIGWLILGRLAREQHAEALSSSERQLLALYRHAPVPLWKEDYSAVREELDRLRNEVGPNLDAHFRGYPGEVWRLASLVKVVGVNDAVLKLVGVQAQEEVHNTLDSFLNEDAIGSFTERLICLANGKTTYQGHSAFVRKDGEVRRLSIHLFVMPGHEDDLAQVIVSTIDITERERYNREIRESYQLLTRLTDQVPGMIYKYLQTADGHACFPYCNQGIADIVGLTPMQVREDAAPFFALVHPEDLPQVRESIAVSMQNLTPWDCEYRINHPVHGERWLLGFSRPNRQDNGSVLWYGYIKDVTERKRLEARLELASRVFEAAGEAILVTDPNAVIVATNPAFERVTGYSEAEVLGKNPRILSSGRQDREFYRKMWATILEQGSWSGEVMNRRKNGEIYPQWLTLSSVRDTHGMVRYYVSVFSDLTEIRSAQTLAERRALEDSLTGLANRSALIRHLDREITRLRGRALYSALLMIDIDDFKVLNEVHGLVAGDRLLKKVASTLSSVAGPDSLVARFGADEFAVTLPFEVKSRDEAGRLALELSERLRAALRTLVDDASPGMNVDCSAGIAVFPDTPQDRAAEVLQHGDWALNRAKQVRLEGGPRSIFFQAAMGQQLRERYRLEQELREAVAGGQLRLYLQPQVDVNGRQVSAEALIRWQHPERGLVPPGMFIPLAESSGLIFDLERWMLREVCRLVAQLDARGKVLSIALNISARHFEQESFVADVQQALAISGADPTRLVLEITESIIIDNMAAVTAKMHELTKLGLRFSLDDFGTGYSSLSYLKRLPIHEIKIDRSFIMDAPTTPSDAALVEIIVSVAKTLKLQVVAEGVETQAQADFLKTHSEVIHQGYFYDKPLPLADWLKKYIDEA